MKKCKGCEQEIDKYAIACEYCGKVDAEREKSKTEHGHEEKKSQKRPEKK